MAIDLRNRSVSFYNDISAFPTIGSLKTLYVDRTAMLIYIWDGSSYVPAESGGSSITVVANYSALPDPTTVTGEFFWCSASQGTAWLPGSLGGTYYSNGLYYSNGVSWEFVATPYQATQAEVDTGTNDDKFVTPKTLETKPLAVSRTGTSISFDKIAVYNSSSSPATGNITNDLTGARIGVVQKIYHNNSVAPTFPAGWVKIEGDYVISIENIIFAEWISGTRVEYWVVNDAPSGFVPYTGATANVDLGTFHLDAGKGTFSHNGSTDTLTATHSSGAGIGLLITKGGNNEGLKVNKTSGSGNAATIIGTLEATTLVKTGGLATEFLMADGSTSLGGGGGITVGTTAVTSGTIGRVFFEGTGNVVQQSASLFWDNTNARLGVGATPASTVRLDVRAQGALSTDIAFRVRNSADSANTLSVQGDGQVVFLTNTTNTITIGGTGSRPTIFGTSIQIGVSTGGNRLSFGTGDGFIGSFNHINGTHTFRNNFNDDRGTTLILGDQNSALYFYAKNGQNLYLSTSPNTAAKTWQKSFWIQNGVPPNESLVDHFSMYSTDITAGNAAPHFRTENGSIVKLYQEAAVTTTQGVANALTNLGVLASSTIAPTIQSVASAATVTPTFTNDLVKITAQAVALTLAAPTGTAIDGKDLMIRIKDNGSAQTITWTSGAGGYRAIGITLPTTTVISKTTYVGLIYNSDDSVWDVIGVTTEV